jgi:hypothetical protein
MLTHGIGYWEDQFQIIDSDMDCVEDGHDFVFPDSVQDGYQAPGPLQIQADVGEVDGPIAMGSSAPILINTPKRFIQDEFAHSIAFEKILEHPSENQGITAINPDVFNFFLKRHSELLQCSQLLRNNQLQMCETILISNSRHLILPRFHLLWLCMFCLRNPEQVSLLRTRLAQGKQVMERMKAIQDSQGISLALSDMITLDIHKMACQMTPVGSFMESPMMTSEDTFWKLWRIDVELCLTHIVFFQGIEQIWSARYVKGSVNVGKSLGQLQRIQLELSQIEQVPSEGIVGNCIRVLQSNIQESMDYMVACAKILPSMFPFVCQSFLQHVSIEDNRDEGISALYRLSQSKMSGVPALLTLLFVIQHRTPTFLTLMPDNEYRDQLSILTMIDPSNDVVTYLLSVSYKRLGRIDFANLQTQKVVTNTHVQNLLTYEKANCLALQSKWNESHEVFKDLWEKALVRHQDGVVQLLDLWIALGYCGTGIFMDSGPLALDYVHSSLIPLLEQSQNQVYFY